MERKDKINVSPSIGMWVLFLFLSFFLFSYSCLIYLDLPYITHTLAQCTYTKKRGANI